MKKITVILTVMLTGSFCQVTSAQSLINDMQTCQGLLDFMQQKLIKASEHYDSAKIKNIQVALKKYDDYIQNNIVTPGLIKFNGGDRNKANIMQKQVDTYKHTITQGLKARDSNAQLTSNHAVSLNNCAKKAVPLGQDLEDLKIAINDIVDLAQSN